ncbi:ParA family protein [Caballeronia concitans]|uniref:Cobyrinic acid a,c-diamide synthase n=1 Tax=Caballeronia concitans TaxID=1777133 RepID=A0A658R5M8_9BURK|nr:ParA family protein [Caballeronia concitans]SAL52646.1 cobyrinic acid a,c-diamide synthase [Caballeronia concitans]
MASVIAFVSQKGGVGKSTLARALAREAAAGGLRVKVADLDTQQGTSVDWHRTRMDAAIEPSVSVESYKTAAQALAVADHFDILILDGPARTSQATLDIAKAASLVVQPTGASLDDLRPAVREFHALVKAGIPSGRLTFALNRIGTDAEEADARAYLGEAGYSVLSGCLVERPAYRQAQNGGYAITETRYAALNARADALIQSLIDATE